MGATQRDLDWHDEPIPLGVRIVFGASWGFLPVFRFKGLSDVRPDPVVFMSSVAIWPLPTIMMAGARMMLPEAWVSTAMVVFIVLGWALTAAVIGASLRRGPRDEG